MLLRLATSLGRPYNQWGLPDHPLEAEMVFRVEPRGEGIRDSRNVLVYSTTHSGFPSHTDGSGKPHPYDIVMLYCVRQDDVGGESILITLDEVMKLLKPQSIDVLRNETFPVPFVVAPIISGEGSDIWIRCNAEELSLYSRLRGPAFTGGPRDVLADWPCTSASLQNSVTSFT